MKSCSSQTLPVLFEMAKSHFVLGAGFGSFEWLYKMWEPDHLLMTSYFNQAHNDPIQLIIEGGLPAIAIFIRIRVDTFVAQRSDWTRHNPAKAYAVFNHRSTVRHSDYFGGELCRLPAKNTLHDVLFCNNARYFFDATCFNQNGC